MTRSLLLFLLISILPGAIMFAQLTGTKTIPGNYPTIAAAISALNTQGAGPGGVTFNIAANYSETFTSPTSGLITTASGSATRPIVFRKSGTGANPVVTSTAGAFSMADYIFCIAGTDYITFNQVDAYEPTGLTEWGYAVLKAGETNGSQNVTISNCTITLERSNYLTTGIISDNVVPSAPQVKLTISSYQGTNSNNKYFGNTILNCYNGIRILGFRDPEYPYAFYDQKCEIGVEGVNTITDFGGDVPDCYGIYTYHQSGQKVANNIIGGYSGGSGECAGIKIDTVNNSNIDVFNNTISIYYYGSGSFYGILDVHGNNFTDATTMSIYNNLVTNCVYDSPEYSNCTFISVRAGATVNSFYNNTVSNSIYGTGFTPAEGTLYGIFFHGSLNMPGTVSYHHNTVKGITRGQSFPGGGETNYMRVFGGGNSYDIYNNTVDSNIVASDGDCIGMYCLADPRGHKQIRGNVVTNLLNARGNVDGIATGNSNSTDIFGNRIQNLNTYGPNSKVIGLNINDLLLTGPINCYNNIIGDLNTPNSAHLHAITGISADPYNADLLGIYNNTVYINGSSITETFGSTGILLGTYPKKYQLINNIVVNKSLPKGPGVTSVIRFTTDQFNNYLPTSNRNLLYAGPPGPSNVIMQAGTLKFQTLAHFRERMMPADGQSMSQMPAFFNPEVSPMDLHIDPASPSPVESAGNQVNSPAIAADIDADPRFPHPGYPVNLSFPPIGPDMGADEFAGIPNDIVAPFISFVPLMNTSSPDGRTLNATITDQRGVPVSGTGLPRIAWKTNRNGTWLHASGVPSGDNLYTFSFGAGAALWDTVFYYVLAQDSWTVPNTGSFPAIGAGGFTASPPAASTPPDSPLSYRIVPGICGTIPVGAGQTYPTLTAAISDLDNKELTCPVIFLLTDSTYDNETYPIIIRRIAGASETNTLTIKPAPGKSPVFQTSYRGVDPDYRSMITLDGSQHVIIDGSNTSGSDRNLTFRNTNLFGFTAVIGFYNSGTITASDIIVRNCIVQANSGAGMNNQCITTQSVIGNGGFHNIVIHNNAINSARFGLQVFGTESNPALNWTITKNTIGSMDYFSNINGWTIALEYCNNITIQDNELIGSVEGRISPGPYCGIYIGRQAYNTRVISNLIHDFYQTGTDVPSDGAAGIMYINPSLSGITEIYNNSIYNIKSPGRSTDLTSPNAFGIYISNGGNLKINHNTIFLNGNYLSPAADGMSSCVGTWNNIVNVELRNNIFKNSSQYYTGSGGSKSYALTFGSNNSGISMDFNNYFVNGTGPFIGHYNGNNYATLADWKAATGQEVSGTNIDPVFTTPAFLKPTTTLLNHSGSYLSTVTRDITGLNRSNPPDAGAYEYSVNPLVTTMDATEVTASQATFRGTINASYKIVDSYFDYGTTALLGSTIPANPPTVMGNTAIPVSATRPDLAPQTTYHFRLRGVTTEGIETYGEVLTFTTDAGIPQNITPGGSFSSDTCFNATETIIVGGGSQPFTVSPAGHVTLIAGQRIRMLPGTTVEAGGYLLGTIAVNGEYCSQLNPANAGPNSPVTGTEGHGLATTGDFRARLWPNPVNDEFTIRTTGTLQGESVMATLYNTNGILLRSWDLTGSNEFGATVRGIDQGIYLLRVKSSLGEQIIKMVKL